MPLTVKEILRLPVMKDAVVHSGFHMLDKQFVEWVSVIETPVENFVRKNEFVLSTGIGCKEDEQLLLQFVKEIIDSKAAALIISMGRFIQSVPSTVLEYARKHDFIILEIPWAVRFSDIIHSTLEAIHDHARQTFQQSEDVQKQLLNLILQGVDMNEIANFVWKTFQLPTIITDKRGRVKAKSKQTDKLKNKWQAYLENLDEPISPVEKETYASITPTQWLTIKDETVLKMSIYTASELQGFILVSIGTHPPSNLIPLLEHVATAVALRFLHEHAVQDTESRLRDDFVWSLAKGKVSSWETALSRAKSLNFQISLPYVCLIGFPENLNQLYAKDNASLASLEHWLLRKIKVLEEEVYETAWNLQRKVMTTFQREQLVIFLEVFEDRCHEDATRFLHHFEKRLSNVLPGVIFSWGIAKQYGYQKFHESFKEAERALKIGRRQKGPGHQSAYADTRIDRVLFGLLDNEDLKQITYSTIGSLIDYSTDRGIDLLHTFVTYNQHRGNVSQTARHLNLHRQSLLYRLRKIESLTGCSLDEPDDVFLIDLSVRLWTYGIEQEADKKKK